MFELRWLVKDSNHGSDRVLQYRTQVTQSHCDEWGGTWIEKVWTAWKDVPEVKDDF